MTIFRFKKKVIQFRITIFQIKKTPITIRIIKKLILGIVFFYRQSKGVLHTPHMYIDF